MITLSDYFTRSSTGQKLDEIFADELTDEVLGHARALILRVNSLLTQFYAECPEAPRRTINSGWRPRAINTEVGGAPSSCHLSGQAMDLSDADRLFSKWCIANADKVKEAELCGERPEATPTWVHLQTKPVASGSVWYWPSTAAYNKFVASGKPFMVTA